MRDRSGRIAVVDRYRESMESWKSVLHCAPSILVEQGSPVHRVLRRLAAHQGPTPPLILFEFSAEHWKYPRTSNVNQSRSQRCD